MLRSLPRLLTHLSSLPVRMLPRCLHKQYLTCLILQCPSMTTLGVWMLAVTLVACLVCLRMPRKGSRSTLLPSLPLGLPAASRPPLRTCLPCLLMFLTLSGWILLWHPGSRRECGRPCLGVSLLKRLHRSLYPSFAPLSILLLSCLRRSIDALVHLLSFWIVLLLFSPLSFTKTWELIVLLGTPGPQKEGPVREP